MHAVALLMGVKGVEGFAQGQLVPVATEHGQATVAAQLARHHIHQPHIAAVGVEEQQFFHATAGHRLTQTAPLLDDR